MNKHTLVTQTKRTGIKLQVQCLGAGVKRLCDIMLVPNSEYMHPIPYYYPMVSCWFAIAGLYKSYYFSICEPARDVIHECY